jgi:hypothetical protein
MEYGGSLPCSREAATGPYAEPDKSNPHPMSLTDPMELRSSWQAANGLATQELPNIFRNP